MQLKFYYLGSWLNLYLSILKKYQLMNRRKFINLIGCSCLSFGLHGCASAPITDRKQLKIIPESKLNAQAAAIYEKVKEKEKMSDDQKTLDQIKEIGEKNRIFYKFLLR